MTPAPEQPPGRPRRSTVRVRRGLRFLPLLGVIYCLSSAGPAGIEEIVPTSGPGLTLLLILLMPILYGLPLGLASGELSSRYPVEGGYYRWVREVFGEYWGFQCGWWSWLGAFFDGALYAVLVAEYSYDYMPGAWRPVARYVIPLLVILLSTWINVRGIELVGWSTLLFNIFLLCPFAVICVMGAFHWNHNPFAPITLNPIGSGYTSGEGISIPCSEACACASSSSIAFFPVPDTDWYVATTSRSIPTARWIGASATTICIVEQFGFAISP